MIEHLNAQKHSCHDLQFSVLQVLSKAMSKEQIIDAETLWKKKMLTYDVNVNEEVSHALMNF